MSRKTIPTRITLTMLQHARPRACKDQRDLFAATFPEGMEVTEANLLYAAKAGLDLAWAARAFLPTPLRADYEAKCARLQADYEAKWARLQADYEAKWARLLWSVIAASRAVSP